MTALDGRDCKKDKEADLTVIFILYGYCKNLSAIELFLSHNLSLLEFFLCERLFPLGIVGRIP